MVDNFFYYLGNRPAKKGDENIVYDEFETTCKNKFFSKPKYVNSDFNIAPYSTRYAMNVQEVLTPMIMLEVQIKQAATKSMSTRNTSQFLDFLGDIGGFGIAVMVILAFFGEYFSSKQFIERVAEDLYVIENKKPKYVFEGGEEAATIEKEKQFAEDLRDIENMVTIKRKDDVNKMPKDMF